MNIFLAFLSTLLSSLSSIFLKKSLKYNINLWNNDFLWQIWPLVVFLSFYFFIWFSFEIKTYITFENLGYIFLTMIVYTIWQYYHSKIFKVEKITYLLPYENLSKIFTIVFWFLIFADISYITLSIIFFTIGVIMLFSIDIKNITFSKNIALFSFAHILFALWNVLSAYILLTIDKWWLWVSGLFFITTYLVIGTFVFFLFFLYKKWYKELYGIDTWFYIFRWVSGVFSWFSWFLSLVIISKIGLSLSILLSFIWIFTTLIFAVIILKEKPQIKDIFLTIIVLLLISIWFYFQ